jgi:predicted aminopeptidase
LLQDEHYQEVIALLIASRDELRRVYSSHAAPADMRRSKREVFAKLRASYARLRDSWGGHAPFDGWFGGDLNNAYLASVATYFDCVPGFKRELDAVSGNLPAFYARARALAKLDKKQRDAIVCGRT